MSNKISAQHILVDQKFEAEDIIKKINDGEEFADLAKSFSKCGSATDGGNLGEFSKGMMVPEFEKAAFALDVGQVSEPIQTQFGHHIIKRNQ
ncbi:peptidylprolyl isomerase [Bacteriovoracaceae bacterium]|nr:peptidylprolyl isomerase [Bacteriovoracaceae bacterium]